MKKITYLVAIIISLFMVATSAFSHDDTMSNIDVSQGEYEAGHDGVIGTVNEGDVSGFGNGWVPSVRNENMKNAYNNEEPIFCTMDAKACPDGSFVGRGGPNCEFSACPNESGSNDVDEKPIYIDYKHKEEAEYMYELKDSNNNKEKTGYGYVHSHNINDAEEMHILLHEVTVVGSEVREEVADGRDIRGWDPESKEVIFKIEDIHTKQDVSDYVTALLVDYEQIKTIAVADDEIRLTSVQPVKLFGFIDVSMEQEVKVFTKEGKETKVEVNSPWWSFLSKKTISSNQIKEEIKLEVEVERGIVFENFEQTGQEFQSLQTNSNILRVVHNTLISILENIR